MTRPFVHDVVVTDESDPDHQRGAQDEVGDGAGGVTDGMTAAHVQRLRMRRSDGRIPSEVVDAKDGAGPHLETAAAVRAYRDAHHGLLPGEGGGR